MSTLGTVVNEIESLEGFSVEQTGSCYSIYHKSFGEDVAVLLREGEFVESFPGVISNNFKTSLMDVAEKHKYSWNTPSVAGSESELGPDLDI